MREEKQGVSSSSIVAGTVFDLLEANKKGKGEKKSLPWLSNHKGGGGGDEEGNVKEERRTKHLPLARVKVSTFRQQSRGFSSSNRSSIEGFHKETRGVEGLIGSFSCFFPSNGL